MFWSMVMMARHYRAAFTTLIKIAICAFHSLQRIACLKKATLPPTFQHRSKSTPVKALNINSPFIQKGGGSANKAFLHQKTKAVLNPESLREFVRTAILELGTFRLPALSPCDCDWRHISRTDDEDGQNGINQGT
jgi:hypothetical protein